MKLLNSRSAALAWVRSRSGFSIPVGVITSPLLARKHPTKLIIRKKHKKKATAVLMIPPSLMRKSGLYFPKTTIREVNYFSYCRSRICGTKYLGANNQYLSAPSHKITNIIQSNPTVYLYFDWQPPVLNYLSQSFYLFKGRGNKLLPTEARIDGHN